jgi:hypothetical protein
MNFEPDTGELREDIPASQQVIEAREHAADGKPVPARSRAASNMMKMLNDGEFDAEASAMMRGLLRSLEAHAHNNKGQAKGEMTMRFKFTYANEVLVVTPDVKVKEPVAPAIGTALFIGEDLSVGRNPPGQRALFGVNPRDPDAEREVRDI